MRLQRTNRGILLRGSVEAPLRRTCARCLDPYVETVDLQLAEEFLPSVDPQRGVRSRRRRMTRRRSRSTPSTRST